MEWKATPHCPVWPQTESCLLDTNCLFWASVASCAMGTSMPSSRRTSGCRAKVEVNRGCLSFRRPESQLRDQLAHEWSGGGRCCSPRPPTLGTECFFFPKGSSLVFGENTGELHSPLATHVRGHTAGTDSRRAGSTPTCLAKDPPLLQASVSPFYEGVQLWGRSWQPLHH